MNEHETGSAQKRKRGRPPKLQWPEPIPDSPENIARAMLTAPPRKVGDWEYLQEARREPEDREE